MNMHCRPRVLPRGDIPSFVFSIMSIYTRARPTVSAVNTDTNEDPEISTSGPRKVAEKKTGSSVSLGTCSSSLRVYTMMTG